MMLARHPEVLTDSLWRILCAMQFDSRDDSPGQARSGAAKARVARRANRAWLARLALVAPPALVLLHAVLAAQAPAPRAWRGGPPCRISSRCSRPVSCHPRTVAP